jgi:uncharacterized membrane protein YfcA
MPQLSLRATTTSLWAVMTEILSRSVSYIRKKHLHGKIVAMG